MPGMKPEDVYELVASGDPRVSPDGRTVAYTLLTIDPESKEYRSAIWTVSADGSSPARRFTHGGKRDALPRWAPGGERLAFVSNRDSDVAQLYVIPTSGGEARKLTDLKQDVEEVEWSPDGTKIAFTSRVRHADYDEEDEKKRRPRHITRLKYKVDSIGWTFDRPKHLFVIDPDGGREPIQLTDGDFDHHGPSWTSDSSTIVFASARHDDWDIDTATDLYAVPAAGGDIELLTSSDATCSAPSVSPDGTLVAYQYSPGRFDWPRHTQIAVLDLQTRTRRVLTESLDRNCTIFGAGREPIWNDDRILFAVEDAGNNHLYMTTTGGPPQLVLEGKDQRLAGYDLSGGVGVHVATTPTMLPELFCGERKLTSHGDEFAAARELVAPERFTAISKDGSEVEAWVMPPVGAETGRRYPVLLNIHGGPFTQYGNVFFDEFQVYAAAGYAVVYSNPRGSSGYSEAWGRAIRGPANEGPGMGTVDYEDVMAVTDEAVKRFDFCDPERLGVMGGSYGGYMTTWIVSHTDRFKAACSERAVNDWWSMHGSSDIGWSFTGYIGANQFDDPEAWRSMSPIMQAKSITTPLLVLHSEHDYRCNVEQATHLFTTLRMLRRDVELVLFGPESHELSRAGSPTHRVQRFDAILDWFGRKL